MEVSRQSGTLAILKVVILQGAQSAGPIKLLVSHTSVLLTTMKSLFKLQRRLLPSRLYFFDKD